MSTPRLKKGDLKFTLKGYKLKGSWVLVRTSGRYPGARDSSRGGGSRSWLLIKHRDEWSGDVNITEFAPRSVNSDGEFEDILAEDTPAVWTSHRPAKGGESGAMLARNHRTGGNAQSGPGRRGSGRRRPERRPPSRGVNPRPQRPPPSRKRPAREPPEKRRPEARATW